MRQHFHYDYSGYKRQGSKEYLFKTDCNLQVGLLHRIGLQDNNNLDLT